MAFSKIILNGETLMDVTQDTVAANNLLQGETATGSNGEGVVGGMPNRGTVTETLDCGESYTILAGYHSGSGTVTANSLASQTGVDSGKTAAGNAQILTGYQAWSNGVKRTGSMANRGAVSETLDCGESYTILAGYHNGSGTVTANSLASQTGVDSGYSAATNATILSGYQAWVNGVKRTGSMATLTSSNFTGTHSGTTAGAASTYSVKSSSAGYVANNTTVNSLTAGTSATIATTAATGTKTINCIPGYYNKISVNQTAAYNAGKAAGGGSLIHTHSKTINTWATTYNQAYDQTYSFTITSYSDYKNVTQANMVVTMYVTDKLTAGTTGAFGIKSFTYTASSGTVKLTIATGNGNGSSERPFTAQFKVYRLA